MPIVPELRDYCYGVFQRCNCLISVGNGEKPILPAIRKGDNFFEGEGIPLTWKPRVFIDMTPELIKEHIEEMESSGEIEIGWRPDAN